MIVAAPSFINVTPKPWEGCEPFLLMSIFCALLLECDSRLSRVCRVLWRSECNQRTHFCRSTTDQSLQAFRVPRPLHSDLRSSVINFAEVVRRQFHLNGSNVLFQVAQFRDAWNRRDPRLLGHHPGQRDLRGRRLLSLCDLSN